MMTDSQKLRYIHQLGEHIRTLKTIKRDLKSHNFKRFKSAGTSQWKGNVKTNRFNYEYDAGKLAYDNAILAIDDAISTCQYRQMALAFTIKNPVNKVLGFTSARY